MRGFTAAIPSGIPKSADSSNVRQLRSSAIHFASGILLADTRAAGDFSARQLGSAPGVKILRLGPALFLLQLSA